MSEATQPAAAHAETAVPSKIYLVSYPKIIFLYPTFLAAIFASIYLSWIGPENVNPQHQGAVVVSAIFLWVLSVNLVVFSFDFPRGTSLTLFFFIAAAVFGAFLLFQSRPDLLPSLKAFFASIRPLANATFYQVFSTVVALIYLVVLATVQFDYWEVRPNELLHHHGFLSDLERYAAPNLRITKEINDVFEYMLLRSGRLILNPSNEPRSFVLENVLFIGRKEEQLTRMLGALQVQVRTDAQA
jgi:hypothetical protein